MKRPSSIAMRRSQPDPEAVQSQPQDARDAHSDVGPGTDTATLLWQHMGSAMQASASTASSTSASSGGVIGLDPQWRARLNEIGGAAGLSEAQESEFERLANAHLVRIDTEIRRLLRELKPHFGTPGEDAAKHRYETGLKMLKAELDQETADLLQRFGVAREADDVAQH